MKPIHLSAMRTACILVPMFVFAILRLPVLIHQPGIQDEQWFAVPGWTVWQEGIPRIPYLPTRNRSTFFENADVCLMTLPPGLFYVQAPFFGLFPAGYPTARLPSFLAALAAIGITFVVCKRLGCTDYSAGAASLLVALSRPLLFTGLTARPDLLASLSGWISMICAWSLLKHSTGTTHRLAFASGVFSGLGGLFHPFALVFAIQGGVAMLLGGTGRFAKLKRLGLFVFGNALALCLWLPLIIAYPYEFRSQFFTNVLDRAGPGVFARMAWPFPSLKHHGGLLVELFEHWQGSLMLLALLGGSVLLWRNRFIPKPERIGFLGLVWSSMFLTATVAGIHTIKWYWVYATIWVIAMATAGVDGWIKRAIDSNANRFNRPAHWATLALGFFLLVMLTLPGTGLRTTWIYLSRWKDPSVYAPAFIAGVMDDLPEDGLFYVDLSYVFNIYLSGRQTRLCQEREHFWGPAPEDYSYLVLSWEGQDAKWAEQYDAVPVSRIGDSSIPQTCYVDLYRPRDQSSAGGANVTAPQGTKQ